MQLAENDRTVGMPTELPTDFFIPDSDYDTVIKEPETAPANTINVPTGGNEEVPKEVQIENALAAKLLPTLKQAGISDQSALKIESALKSELEQLFDLQYAPATPPTKS